LAQAGEGVGVRPRRYSARSGPSPTSWPTRILVDRGNHSPEGGRPMKPVRSSVACLVGFVLLAVFAWVGCSNKSSEEHASEAMSTGTESTATKQASAMLAPVKYRWTVYLQLKANGGGDVHGNDGAHLAVAEPPDTAHKVPHGNGKDGYEVT